MKKKHNIAGIAVMVLEKLYNGLGKSFPILCKIPRNIFSS